MNFRIIQVASKVIAIAIVFTLAGGCAKTPKPPVQVEMSQLQIREMQTREYHDVKEPAVMKSVIAALMDEGFIINETNAELGLISAAKEVYELDEATKNIAEFNFGSGAGTYQTTLRSEASATVSKHGEVVRVRINIVQKAVSNAGGNIWSQPLYDMNTYQAIFSKVDKAVFIEKENI
jgi:hypothetical protein